MRNYLFFSIFFVVLGLYSCADEVSPPKLTTSEIALKVPAKDILFDLENTLNLVFAWEDAFLVDKYELAFSAKEDISNPVMVTVNRTPHLIGSSDMNDIAAKLGILSGDEGKIFWTVQSVKPSQPSVAEVRSMTIKRLVGQPLTPVKDAVIELDYQASNTEVKFTWEPMPVDDYQLIISANADLSDPLLNRTVSTTLESLTYQALQDIIENPANNLKRFKQNTLYWNVKAGDRILASPSWQFKLYGMQVFTDVRGDESITYQVSRIPTETGEIIWMSENLRATKLVNGTDLVYDEAGGGQESWSSQYFPAEVAKTSASTFVPEPIRRHAGVYYRVNMIGNNSSSVTWPSLLAPEGWKVPTEQDFKNLVNAAVKVSDATEVLRHPDGHPALVVGGVPLKKELMNQWNMNMVACGTNRVGNPGSYYVSEFANLDWYHMIYAIHSVSQCVTVEIAGGKGNARAIGLGYNAPVVVRLMYIGDD